jgi:DNA-binding CsgD family transcriptional regulator
MTGALLGLHRAAATLSAYSAAVQLGLIDYIDRTPVLSILRGDIPGALRTVENPGAAEVQFYLPGAMHYVAYIKTTVTFVAGDLPGALTVADAGLALAEQVGEDWIVVRALAARAFLLAEQGELDRAAADLAAARARFDPAHDDIVMATDLAETAYALRVETAVADTVYRPPRPLGDMLVDWLRVAYVGYLAVARKDFAAARRAVDHLRIAGKTALFLDALANRQEGLTLALSGDHVTARDLLRHAAASLRGMGAPVLAAHAEVEGLELDDSPGPDAISRCADALAGLKPWIARVQALSGVQPLSRREREVVRLVGEGLTNGQIAERLFLSERTVETHLHNSYKKLRLTTRPALTRWALEHTDD